MRRRHRLHGLGEPITLAAIPWLWVAGGALFARLFVKRKLTDKDMEVAQTMRDLLNRADRELAILDPSATDEQRGIFAAVYANNMALAVGYDFGGEGVFLETNDDGSFKKDAAGNVIVAKRTGYVEGDMCEVLALAKRDAGAPDKKLIPCRNLTKAEAFLPQEEVIAIARLAKNRVDVSRRQAGTLQGRM
jgi:hypothetical protein